MARPRKIPEARDPDMDRVKQLVADMYTEILLPRSDMDFSGADYIKKVGYMEHALEELVAELGIGG